MELQFLRADGTPAAGALVGMAQAPVSMPDLAMVADAKGRVCIELPVSGHFVLSVWAGGREHRLPCELAPGAGSRVLRLPD
ncbi:MAG: hypothetical protein LH480_13100 [Rubrivivax sp.]|nr:hypothetical protein [Rubrivivax sp.]